MPRAKKPVGPAGKAQRHDTVMPTQPAVAPTGMAYGAHNDAIAAQNAMPLPQAPPPGTPPPSGPPGSGGGAPPGFGGAIDAASAMQPPSQLLSDPTARPGEPLTHGMPFGPGAGPEALQAPDPRQTTAAILNQLGTNIDPQTKALRDTLNAQLRNQGAE